MAKIIVEIHNDWEGMFGGVLSEEMDKIDVDRTIVEYEKLLLNELEIEYPDIDFRLYYGNYTCDPIFVDICDDWDMEWTIKETVSEIIATVYERGEFWYDKEKGE